MSTPRIALVRLAHRNSYLPAIVSGEATVLDVVKALGPYLTAEEDDHRTKGASHLPSRTTHILTIHHWHPDGTQESNSSHCSSSHVHPRS